MDVTLNHADFGQVRSLLQRPESEEVWRALFELLEAWPDRQQLEHEVLPYVRDVMSRWRHTWGECPPRASRFGWSFVEEQGMVRFEPHDPALFTRLGCVHTIGNRLDRGLSFSGVETMDHSHLAALLGSPYFGAVRQLELEDFFIGDEMAQVFTQTDLRALDALRFESNYLGDDGVKVLMRSDLSALRRLALRGVVLTSEGLPALAGAELSALRSLELDENNLGGAQELSALRGASWSRLERLSMVGCQLRDRDVEAIAGAPSLMGLRTLMLSKNRITQAGLKSLWRCEGFKSLKRLELASNRVTSLDELIDEPSAFELHALSLEGNRLLATAFKVLAQHPALAQLHELNLARTGLSAEGISELAKSPHLGQLKTLALGANPLTPSAIDALGEHGFLSHIERLSLDSISLGVDGLRRLLQAEMPRLRHLSLRFCNLYNEGIALLASSPLLAQLETLNISHNGCDLSALRSLFMSPHASTLTQLKVRELVYDFGERLHALDPPSFVRVM